MYLVDHSPKNLNTSKIRTVRDVLTKWTPSLGDLKKVYGKEWIVNYIAAWLLYLNESTHVKTKMTGGQMDFIAERIYDKYSLRIADLTLFFRNIKEGVYGNFYENLSQEKIMQWLSEYFNHRCEMAQMVSSVKHNEFSTKIDKMHPDVFKKMFEGVGEEKVIHSHKKNGLGSRINIQLNSKIKEYTTDRLKNYLLENDINSFKYSETIYQAIEQELDRRR